MTIILFAVLSVIIEELLRKPVRNFLNRKSTDWTLDSDGYAVHNRVGAGSAVGQSH